MELREELQQLMTSRNFTQASVARAIGKSTAVINQFLSGKYNGDTEAVNTLIQGFIRREREKSKMKRLEVSFVATVNAKRGLEVIRYAHLENDICAITGAAGVGKSMTLAEYAAREQDAILIEVDPNYTARVLLEELCHRLGINRRGNMHDLSKACVQALRDSGRLLLIDEAELLPYRALEVLRRLHDKAGVGIVLAGMPRLLVNLRGKRGEFAQLYSRVGLSLPLGDALSRDDFNLLAVSMMPEAADAKISDALFTSSRGNARRLGKLLRGVNRTCEISNTPVSVAAVKKFAEMLIH
ncbi:TPA: AAA family ATPase [Salmonella enterica]|nr:AAA family ATPase [Salmonella enterica]MCH5735393.1 AAA family ATPase [Salmonella enterica]MCH5741827.1 AAA family ATPase [Salmonella enterica]MCH5746925.1 AAA family ATPase [Salmonella enterica]MCH5757107.1 AAA family ATPase [Salmonella enterica]